MESGIPIQYFNSTTEVRHKYPHYWYWEVHDVGDTTGILNGALGSSWLALNSSRDFDEYNYPRVLIYGDGCLTEGNQHNCSQVCGNRTALFGNWLTQWTCLTLATLFLSNALNFNSSQRGLIDNALKPLDMALGKNDTGFNAMGVLEAINDCAKASCNDDSMGACTLNVTFPASAADGEKGWMSLYEFWNQLSKNICDDVKSSINVDIGGPGILISYIMQGSIALYAWGVVRVFTATRTINSFMAPFVWLYFRFEGKRATRPPFTELHPRFAGLLQRIKENNFAHSTSSFLAELQEGQCFVTLAVQIALWYANSEDAEFNGAQNWQSMADTRSIILTLGITSLAAVTLAQMNLRRLGLDSFYTFLLATSVVILTSVLSDKVLKPSSDKFREMFQDTNKVQECGGNPSLRTFCMDQGYDPSWRLLYYLCWVALGVLWLKKLWRELGGAQWYLIKSQGLPKKAQKVISSAGLALSKLTTGFMFYVEITMLGLIVVGINKVKFAFDDILSAQTWNIGQIIAMLVWAPVLSKYLYLIIGKSITPSQVFAWNLNLLDIELS
ncbi:hypothetical protein B0T10DRAFT_581400 [Thelonectria olida]|uniref:Uncharacterized protein n=1 Tax=Thelonectria olida TaxID=1576542 RepID=A0A9P9AHU7_9HYPO|nr:hypothetical protein B0T10DRAFT_581400 [Thelonectria olida]